MVEKHLFLATRNNVIDNTREWWIKAGQTKDAEESIKESTGAYYSRVSAVNNTKRFGSTYCWVHETATHLRKFDDGLACSCKGDENEVCPEEAHVREKLSLGSSLIIIEFGSPQCMSVIFNGTLYLYSNLGNCKNSFKCINLESCRSNTSIICEDCKTTKNSVTRDDLQSILHGIIETGEEAKYGLTLLEKIPLANDPEKALKCAQESVKSLAFLEGPCYTPADSEFSVNTVDGEIVMDEALPGSPLPGIVVQEKSNDLKVDEEKLRAHLTQCNEYAHLLVKRAYAELDSVCSSLINQADSFCQPPIKVHIRWLEHWFCFEYLAEYEADLSSCFFDEFSGKFVPDLKKHKIVLHEFVQPSVLSLGDVENSFRISLGRLKDYLVVKRDSNSTSHFVESTPDTRLATPDSALASSSTEVDSVYLGTTDALSSSRTADRLASPGAAAGANENLESPRSTASDVTPYWWNYYHSPNTLGEGDLYSANCTNLDLKRLTRSHHLKDESCTPRSRRSHVQNDILTRCISSDLSSIKNGAARNTVCSDDTLLSAESACFCKHCILSFSDISRVLFSDAAFPPHDPVSTDGVVNAVLVSSFDLHSLHEKLSDLREPTSPGLSSSPSLQGHESPGTRANRVSPVPMRKTSSVESIHADGSLRHEENTHDINESDVILGLRRSIRAAMDIGIALKHKDPRASEEALLKSLNAALMSSFRLGEFLFNDSLGTLPSSMEAIPTHPSSFGGLASHQSIFSQNSDTFESGGVHRQESQDYSLEKRDGGSCRDLLQSDLDFDLKFDSTTAYSEDFLDSSFLDVLIMGDGEPASTSTFENDQYVSDDISSDVEDTCSFSSQSPKLSPNMTLGDSRYEKRKRTSDSPSKSRYADSPSKSRYVDSPSKTKYARSGTYKSSSSLENIPSYAIRRSTRELSHVDPNDDLYIYDMNNLSDKAEMGFDYSGNEDWYIDDSDSSSKRSQKYNQKRMPASRPTTSNLADIYGSADVLIPYDPVPTGVYFDVTRKLWRCQWKENGKFKTKGFSLGHHNTLADARHACILFRCQIGNMAIMPEWLSPNYIKVSDVPNRRANAQPQTSTPKKSSRKKKRGDDGDVVLDMQQTRYASTP
ncbi:hypothetical protein BEWA_004450 [Theileria equi strain WA]|uniref:AP2/ERF domain-containing protein n=1 Tax=Theileria equi strain WA TaxID=1537102 RepID=L0AZL6_THEEQ|nr:hypothetical protein BEWA_004450 [Theileria equi strain WA]AFZ81037.1 hypothetical protein BEWA_004450 [Theileria equi strain WA]|eukprot:XP_004830703.1 hypothetical protein BEWA_004450 [Theileria equi strain WA]